MSKWLHRLSEVNPLSMTAMCSFCGPVKIRKKGDFFRCATAVKDYRRTYGSKHRYHEPNPGLCSICKSTNRVGYDHDHISGEFRGWLCINCNTVLGLIKDNPARLRELADYLEGHT